MTSEVAVMNRLGIALASDSASTVNVDGIDKVYQADKLYMLSHFHPVGAMIYNNSSLLDVPWETILKLFRKELGERSFDTLPEYAKALFGFLNKSKNLFSEDDQKRHYLADLGSVFSDIRKRIEDELLAITVESDGLSTSLFGNMRDTVISKTVSAWRGFPDAPTNEVEWNQVAAEFTSKLSAPISDLILKVFAGFEVNSTNVTELRDLARMIISKDRFLPGATSGLVVAGFGDKEHFPVMLEFRTGMIIDGHLQCKRLNDYAINSDTPSIIRAFAQSEIVETFLNGVSKDYEDEVTRLMIGALVKMPETVVDNFPRVSKDRKEAYKAEVLEISKEAAKEVYGRLQEFKNRRHHDPILQSIEFLPKNELAHVASSLVNLSSFKKRMSITEKETVGGPIDVAVISKGDGFVWISRKHYFRPEMNRHFFNNYPTKAHYFQPGASNDYNPEGTAKPNAVTNTGGQGGGGTAV